MAEWWHTFDEAKRYQATTDRWGERVSGWTVCGEQVGPISWSEACALSLEGFQPWAEGRERK